MRRVVIQVVLLLLYHAFVEAQTASVNVKGASIVKFPTINTLPLILFPMSELVKY